MEDGKETKHTAKTDIAIHPTPNISFNILEGMQIINTSSFVGEHCTTTHEYH